MKKLFFLAAVGISLLSCKDGSSDTTTTTTDSTAYAAKSGAYAPSQGDVTYKNGQLLVYRDGDWKECGELEGIVPEEDELEPFLPEGAEEDWRWLDEG